MGDSGAVGDGDTVVDSAVWVAVAARVRSGVGVEGCQREYDTVGSCFSEKC